MPTTATIRPETADDHAAVRRVNELAFGQGAEADLVDALRRAADPCVSLVAVAGGAVVGHLLLSPVTVEAPGASFTALALAPMAVLPERQRRGIGAELVRAALRAARRLGHHVVFVLGHPGYYPRFGFEPARPKGLGCEYDVPDDVFMVAELEPGALAGRTGTVKYRPEFREVG